MTQLTIPENFKKLEPWHRGLVTDSQRVIAKKVSFFLFWLAVFQAARPQDGQKSELFCCLNLYMYLAVFSFVLVFVLPMWCFTRLLERPEASHTMGK